MKIYKYNVTIGNPWASELSCFETLYRIMAIKGVTPVVFNFYKSESIEILRGWANESALEILEDWVNEFEDLYEMEYKVLETVNINKEVEKYRGITVNYREE